MSIFRFEKVSFQKTFQSPLFEDISWEYKEGEQWGIVGPSGSGKTTFAEAVAGKLHIRNGTVVRPCDPQEIAYLSFEEDSAHFHYRDYYYQQRFQASEADLGMTVQEFLETTSQDFSALASFIDITPLLPLTFIKLSNGQTRKIRLAKALLSQPKCLVLDNPFTGLDVGSRQELAHLFQQLPSLGIPLLIIDEYQHVASFVTHLLILDQCRIAWQGPVRNYSPPAEDASVAIISKVSTLPFHPASFQRIASFSHVSIRYGERAILQDLTWEVRQGERWRVKGPNGAGKSTLFSLLNADIPQAYGQDIVLFDRKRGSGESIWDIKQLIGYYSPELQYYFKHDLSVFQVVATGLTDRVYVQRDVTAQEAECISWHLAYAGLGNKANTAFQTLGKSHQNLVLFLRALIKNPPLLLLDEPFLSLHTEDKVLCKQLLRHYLEQANCTLLIISHHDEEIRGITAKTLELAEGRSKFASQ